MSDQINNILNGCLPKVADQEQPQMSETPSNSPIDEAVEGEAVPLLASSEPSGDFKGTKEILGNGSNKNYKGRNTTNPFRPTGRLPAIPEVATNGDHTSDFPTPSKPHEADLNTVQPSQDESPHPSKQPSQDYQGDPAHLPVQQHQVDHDGQRQRSPPLPIQRPRQHDVFPHGFFRHPSSPEIVNNKLSRALRNHNKFYIQYANQDGLYLYISAGASQPLADRIIKVQKMPTPNTYYWFEIFNSTMNFIDDTDSALLFTNIRFQSGSECELIGDNPPRIKIKFGDVNSDESDKGFEVTLTQNMGDLGIIAVRLVPQGRLANFCCCCRILFNTEYSIMTRSGETIGSIICGRTIELRLLENINNPISNAMKANLLAASVNIFELYCAPSCSRCLTIGSEGWNTIRAFLIAIVVFTVFGLTIWAIVFILINVDGLRNT